MDSEQLIDPVIEHLKVLLKTNVPETQLSAFCKIFNLELKGDFFNVSDAETKKEVKDYLSKKTINRSNPKGDEEGIIDIEGCYIESKLLSGTPRIQNVKRNHILIEHQWKEYLKLKDGGEIDETINISTYDGDTIDLIDSVWKMVPEFNPESKANQMTIMIPFNNSFDEDTFTSGGKGWEVFNLIDLVPLVDESDNDTAFKTLERDINFLSMFNLLGLNDASISKLIYKTNLAGADGSPFIGVGKTHKRERIPGFYLADDKKETFKTLLQRKMDGETAGNINETTKIIHRMKCIDPSFTKFETLFSLQQNDDEGSALDKDLIAIRKGLSYLMSHTSGVAITINMPLSHRKYHAKPRPTLLMPTLWTKSINALRLSTVQNKNINTLLKDQYTNTKITEKEKNKLAKYLGIAEKKKEVEELTKKFVILFDSVDSNTHLAGERLSICQEMFAQILSSNFVKNDFPIREFPNPEVYRFIKKVKK